MKIKTGYDLRYGVWEIDVEKRLDYNIGSQNVLKSLLDSIEEYEKFKDAEIKK